MHDEFPAHRKLSKQDAAIVAIYVLNTHFRGGETRVPRNRVFPTGDKAVMEKPWKPLKSPGLAIQIRPRTSCAEWKCEAT